MQYVQGIDIQQENREEILPGFSEDFPYIATCAEMDKYLHPGAPWHWHRTVELFYVKSGTVTYVTPKGEWTVPAGFGGFVNSNVLHATRVITYGQGTQELIHLFDPLLISGGRGTRMEEKYVLPLTASGVEMILLRPDQPEEAVILEDIRKAFDLSPQEWGYEFRLREQMTGIWLKLLDHVQSRTEQQSGRSSGDDKIKALLVYIHEHYSEPISVEELARAVHISKRLCFRLFQENLRTTPLEYMRSYRLQQACSLLIRTSLPITEIGYACGLGSASYFGKVFRQEFGCSPARFRREWQDRDKNGQG